MHRIVEVRPLKEYRVWIKFSDGVEGTVDLSDIVGKGVFAGMEDPGRFKAVAVDPESKTIFWHGGIDLCPDSLYAEVSGTGVLEESSDA